MTDSLHVDQLRAMAEVMKARMQRRASKAIDDSNICAWATMGMAPDVKPERVETMQVTLGKLREKQRVDTIIYATLLWVLGDTEQIDLNVDLREDG